MTTTHIRQLEAALYVVATLTACAEAPKAELDQWL